MNFSVQGSRGRQFLTAAFAALLIGATGATAASFVSVPSPLTASIASAAAATPCMPSLTLQTTSGNAYQGTSMSYLITAVNSGGIACTNTVVTLYYAANEHFGSSSPSPAPGSYYWNIGTMATGSHESIRLVTNRNADLASGQLTDAACVGASNGTRTCGHTAPVAGPTVVVQAGPVQPAPAPVHVTAPASAPAPSSVAQPAVALPGSSESGVWEWTSAYGMTPSAAQQIVNNASAGGFNVIYETVDSSFNLSGTALANYESSLNTLLTLAAEKGIAVDAEAGASDWALAGGWSKPEAIVSFVANYNQSHAVKFRGVQFDIEPYTLAQYASSPASVLTSYVQMVEAVTNVDRTYGLPLGFDVPFFYTAPTGAPQVTVDGITTYPINHLVRLLNTLPNGRLLVMSYRNTAAGSNGTVAIATPEIQAANGTNVKVIVGQETSNVTPSYITFYGMTKAQMATQVAAVRQSLASNPSFGGMATHYLETYMQLP
ncbi:MAG TPA: hypothetical protein VMT99_00705 [Candidatus Paceibacterota bacterium]|nr:hypothetical protein [Candidatus Paceibacterota bacterium]